MSLSCIHTQCTFVYHSLVGNTPENLTKYKSITLSPGMYVQEQIEGNRKGLFFVVNYEPSMQLQANFLWMDGSNDLDSYYCEYFCKVKYMN